MTVMPREAWTDERLDDLAKRMDKGFDEVKGEIRQLRTTMDANASELRKETRTDFDSIHARLDSMQRTIVICLATLSSGMIASVVAAVLAS
jgi:ribosome recycling factor